MRHSLSKDTGFKRRNSSTPYISLQRLPMFAPWRSHNPERITKSHITGKSFIIINSHYKVKPGAVSYNFMFSCKIMLHSVDKIHCTMKQGQEEPVQKVFLCEFVEKVGTRAKRVIMTCSETSFLFRLGQKCLLSLK